MTRLFPPLQGFLPGETAERTVCTCLCERMMETQECVRQPVQTGREVRAAGNRQSIAFSESQANTEI